MDGGDLLRDMPGHCHQKSSTPTGKAVFFVVVESSTFLSYTTEAPPQSDDDQSGIAKRIAPPLLILRFRETLLEQKLVQHRLLYALRDCKLGLCIADKRFPGESCESNSLAHVKQQFATVQIGFYIPNSARFAEFLPTK